MKRRLQLYIKMSKLRIVSMVLVTCAIGYVLGARGAGEWAWWTFWSCLLGTGMAAAGAACLNNYVERDVDARMRRTRSRALPAGDMEPGDALAYGILMVLGGVVWLVVQVNLLAAFVVLLTAFLYVLVYTPLKRYTWLNTSIGAIPGALPPVTGWAAATGQLDAGAWALFAILFIWQHPHFYAIAWMYREEYKEAGFKMLSSVDETGNRLFRHVIIHSVLLVAAAWLPTATGVTGWVFLLGAVALGVMVLEIGLRAARSRTVDDARGLLRASVYYLPALLVLIGIDMAL